MAHYVRAYACSCSALALLGNHYHLVCRFEAERKLSAEERMAHALKMYPRSRARLEAWTEAQWERFEKRIFDVSELMRNIQSAFALWYNRMYDRKGTFWADRFKSTLLAEPNAVLDCMLYVDLNGVRAGLAERPEDYEGCSAYLREIKRGRWLMPLSEVLGERRRDLYAKYKEMLYYRGAVRTKENQRVISEATVKAESAV